MLFLAVADYFFQKYNLEKEMKMTKQEVKEEFKNREGDPLIKSKIRNAQREMATKRMMEDVPKADVIITTGGVSVGEEDYIKAAVEQLGAMGLWKVAIKPGKPFAFGHVDCTPFIGLPGNPVSVMVTFYQFVQPALRKLMGETADAPLTIRARSESKLRKRPGRIEYQRGVLNRDDSGELVVRRTGAQGSGILSSMSQANCFIVLPMDNAGVAPGDMVDVQPFFGLLG